MSLGVNCLKQSICYAIRELLNACFFFNFFQACKCYHLYTIIFEALNTDYFTAFTLCCLQSSPFCHEVKDHGRQIIGRSDSGFNFRRRDLYLRLLH